jgi:predicted RNA-binding protein YlxR (DUF448 family)
MIEAAVHHESEPVAADRSEDRAEVHGSVRSCVGCGERVDVAGNHALVRLIVSPEGEVAVDARGGGFGRGAHVHPRPECLQKAVDRGLARSAKVKTNTLATESGELVPLSREALAEAIQRSTDRRIEGLLISAKRSHRLAIGADAVRGAWGRGDAELILVARDAAAAADLTEVRQAVAEGRGAAWGDKVRIAALVHGPARTEAHRVGVGVLAVSSRTIAAALLEAIHVADSVTGAPVRTGSRAASKAGASRPRAKASTESPGEGVAEGDQPRLEGSPAASACAPAPEGGKLRPRTVTMGSSPGPQGSPARSGNRGERGRATFTRGRRPG